MYCPYCGRDYSNVKETRTNETRKTKRRRHICLSCGKLFTTYEFNRDQIKAIIRECGGNENEFE